MRHDQEPMNQVRKTFREFQLSSGFKVSYEKTCVYRAGSFRGSDAKLYTQNAITWSNNPINILGIFVTYDENDVYELNYGPIVTKLCNILTASADI